MTTTINPTPGYNSRITIRIRTNKKGRKVAHYFGQARRWFPIKIVDAELFLQQNLAWDVDEA